MSRTTKTLLILSAISFAAGCTGVAWGVGTPLGAIFFGLFLISKILEKETAAFDQEERARIQLAQVQATEKRANRPEPTAQSAQGVASYSHAH